MLEWLIHIDKELMLLLNGMNSPAFDWIMWWISNRFIWIPLYLLILFLYLRKYKSYSTWPIIFTLATLVLSDFISSHYIKVAFHRLRPDYDPEIGHLIHTLRGYTGGLYGFVSSHASNTFALALSCTLFLKNTRLSIILFCWAALVSYSRIYLGVHFPADVFCGALFGCILAILLFYLWMKISFFHHQNREP